SDSWHGCLAAHFSVLCRVRLLAIGDDAHPHLGASAVLRAAPVKEAQGGFWIASGADCALQGDRHRSVVESSSSVLATLSALRNLFCGRVRERSGTSGDPRVAARAPGGSQPAGGRRDGPRLRPESA